MRNNVSSMYIVFGGLFFLLLISGCDSSVVCENGKCIDYYQKCFGIGRDRDLCEQTKYCVWNDSKYTSCGATETPYGPVNTVTIDENCTEYQGHCVSQWG